MKEEENLDSCHEVVENGVWTDTHEWKEVFTTKKMQCLKCSKCGKIETSKFAEGYEPPKDLVK